MNCDGSDTVARLPHAAMAGLGRLKNEKAAKTVKETASMEGDSEECPERVAHLHESASAR